MNIQAILDHADTGLALTLAREIIISKVTTLKNQNQLNARTYKKLHKALHHLDSARCFLDEIVCELYPDHAAVHLYYAAGRLREFTEPRLHIGGGA